MSGELEPHQGSREQYQPQGTEYEAVPGSKWRQQTRKVQGERLHQCVDLWQDVSHEGTLGCGPQGTHQVGAQSGS